MGEYKNVGKLLYNKRNYVIKPRRGHSSDRVFLLQNGVNLFTNRKMNLGELDQIFGLKDETVIIEELLTNHDENSVLDDYKFYVFKGKIEIILHKCFEKDYYTLNYYDHNWKPIIQLKPKSIKGEIKQKPKFFNELKNNVEKIGNTMFSDCFVRIDFYITPKGPVFGEITPNPSNGTGFSKEGLKVLDQLCIKHGLS